MKKGNKVLVTMLVCTAIAMGFGFFVLNQRVQPIPIEERKNDLETVVPTPAPNAEPQTQQLVSTTGWKVYENDKHAFSLKYPPNQKAGSISDNSVLGTFDTPVRGFHVGPLVFIVLKDATLKKDARNYFDTTYNVEVNPPSGEDAEVPPIECTIHKVTNPKVVSIRSVGCKGEGGPAKYAYIEGSAYDVFVDGYSKGFDNSDNGNFSSDADYVTLLSTFSFSTGDQSAVEEKKSAFQSFFIRVDETTATPSEIDVTKDSIIELTFVGASTNTTSLEFKSSVINSGPIFAGQSKTVSFKAREPFSLIGSNYLIKINIEET